MDEMHEVCVCGGVISVGKVLSFLKEVMAPLPFLLVCYWLGQCQQDNVTCRDKPWSSHFGTVWQQVKIVRCQCGNSTSR